MKALERIADLLEKIAAPPMIIGGDEAAGGQIAPDHTTNAGLGRRRANG